MALRLSRRHLLAGTAASTGLLLPGRKLWSQEPLEVGYVYVGPIGDYGWTHGHEVARQAVDAHFGDKVKTSYVENVEEGPDAERVIRQLASSGDGLVFATSFGFMNPTIRVARQFPKVKFEHATGYQTAPNVSVYNARFYEGRAICGNIAGHISKTGIVGYIGSFPIPEVVMGINAFTVAMQKIKPETEVKVVWVNSWYDPGKEGDAAKALIDQGADIICQHTDSPAPLQVAEERGVWGFGQASDMMAYAPKAQLTSILDIWSDYYIQRVQAVLDGTWQSQSIWWGLKEGMVQMSPYGEAVTPEMAQEADAIKEGIIAGTLHPFEGPIENQAGEVMIAEGQHASDQELLTMEWYVKGVQA
ncbi:MAG: BMP family ABC transporter substrate-binding protein [Pseudomonadota bacterium]